MDFSGLTDNYEDVEARRSTYDQYIVGSALRIIQRDRKLEPNLTLLELAESVLASYGGKLEIAIINCFRNMLA